MKFVKDKHTFLAHYVPIAPKDMITLGYITKPNKHLQLFGEFKCGMQSSETCLGFKMAFNSGIIHGTFNTNLKATSQLTMMMDQMLQANVSTIMDFSKPDKPVVFGLGLSFGGG